MKELTPRAEQLLRDAWRVCDPRAKGKIDSLLHYCGRVTESRAQLPLALPTKGEKP